jgi:hypothetical protein
MSINEGLYTALFNRLRAAHPETHVKRIANWVWIIVGLIQSQSVHLSEIALHLPGDGPAVARIAKVRRWLANPFIQPRAFYQPLIETVLSHWHGQNVEIVLDGCLVNHAALQFFRISLVHCYRALPLAWLVVAGPGLIQMEACETMLDHVAYLLRATVSVTFLADRGFRDRDWARKCRALGWTYLIRVANNTVLTFADGHQLAINDLGLKPGQRGYLQNVRLTQEADWLCNLAICWTRPTPKAPPELCAVMTNLRASAGTLAWYLKRMRIEESFRDDKSGGFNLNTTKLTDPTRLDHLLLAIAVAVLWIYQIGEQTLRTQQRRLIDPAFKRQLSLFQIGWRHLRRLLASLRDLRLLPPLTLHIAPFSIEPVWRKC